MFFIFGMIVNIFENYGFVVEKFMFFRFMDLVIMFGLSGRGGVKFSLDCI